MDGFVKVCFRLTQDDDGWPPAASEGLWASPMSGADDEPLYRIENTPWFVPELATEDVVRAHADDDEVLWADEVAQHGPRMTVRLYVYPDGYFHGDLSAAAQEFIPLEVSCEGAKQYRLLALDLGPEHDLPAVKALLCKGVAAGWWEYEEAWVSREWLALPTRPE